MTSKHVESGSCFCDEIVAELRGQPFWVMTTTAAARSAALSPFGSELGLGSSTLRGDNRKPSQRRTVLFGHFARLAEPRSATVTGHFLTRFV
jgi:hypothetical protein